MKKILRYLPVLFIIVSCKNNEGMEFNWIGCDMEIDSVYVSKDATRGAFTINDTLALWAGMKSFHYCNYDSILLDIKALNLKPAQGEWCEIGQVKAPFWLHKEAGSDTLYLNQNGRTFIFRISENFCRDPKLYFK